MELKKNVRILDHALEKIQKLNGVKFEYNDKLPLPDGEQIGFIAQELKEIVPELVQKHGDHLAVKYGNMTALLLEGIKEQQVMINNLNQSYLEKDYEVKILKNKIDQLESSIKQITDPVQT